MAHFELLKEKTKITYGPSSKAMMFSLFRDEGDKLTVQFHLEKLDFSIKPFLDVCIVSLSRENNSGEAWSFTGIVRGHGPINTSFPEKYSKTSPIRVKGFYSSKTRDGYIELNIFS